MRKLHINVRKYTQPFNLVEYDKVFELGIESTIEKRVYINCYGSAMVNPKTNASGIERTPDTKISLIMPNPPFELNTETFKVEMNKKVYVINEINYNLLTRGEIQLFLIFESEKI